MHATYTTKTAADFDYLFDPSILDVYYISHNNLYIYIYIYIYIYNNLIMGASIEQACTWISIMIDRSHQC